MSLGQLFLVSCLLLAPSIACPAPACIFAELGINIGSRCNVSSLETPRRITIGETSLVTYGDASTYSSTLWTDWNVKIPGGMFLTTLFNGLRFQGKEDDRPGPGPFICPVSTRTVSSTTVLPNLNMDILVDYLNPSVTITPGNYGHLVVVNNFNLILNGAGAYHFASFHIMDNATVTYLNDTDATENLQILVQEDIIIEHNVVFDNFGTGTEGGNGVITMLYAGNQDVNYKTRGIEIWNNINQGEPFYVQQMQTLGTISVGFRNNIRGCAEAKRYIEIRNNVDWAPFS